MIERFELLDGRKRECLRLIYARYDIKSIALKLGISPDGVKYHLKGAREALGVSSSTQAARLLCEYEQGSDYLLGVAPPKVVGLAEPLDILDPTTGKRPWIGSEGGTLVSETMASYTPAAGSRVSSFPWPFPTRGSPHNDLKPVTKIRLIFACAISIGAGVLLVAAISQSVGQLSVDIVHLLFQPR